MCSKIVVNDGWVLIMPDRGQSITTHLHSFGSIEACILEAV